MVKFNWVDVVGIVVGQIGTVLNALLYWVIGQNRRIDNKISFIYRNLAAADIFNNLVIPLCYLGVSGEGYILDTEHLAKNGSLYLLFGSAISIPYFMIILLSLLRVLIFRRQLYFSGRITSLHTRIVCCVCWFIGVVGLGIWLCCLIHDQTPQKGTLVWLLKWQCWLWAVLIVITLSLLVGTLVLLRKMKQDHRNLEPSDTSELYSNTETGLLKELKSAQRIFLAFFISILVWSAYLAVFLISFISCGPYYNSPTHSTQFCKLMDNQILNNPKYSYAITLISLCGLSICNSIILLRQRSYRIILVMFWGRFKDWVMGLLAGDRSTSADTTIQEGGVGRRDVVGPDSAVTPSNNQDKADVMTDSSSD